MTDVLVVTGMHRSGTSLVAQLLRAIGWDVGPESDLMPPKPDNPRGFVEHLPAVRINDRIFYRLGGSWHHPPALPPGWEVDEELDDLREEAREVMGILLARDSDRLLVKDPRFSLTLPFWRTVTDVTRVLLVLRPVDAVVTSLLRRGDQLDAAEAARLWTHYLVAGLRNAPAAHLVAADELLTDPAARLRRLVTALGRQSDAAGIAAAVRLVEEDLWGRGGPRAADGERPSAALAQARLLQAAVTGEDREGWRDMLGTLTTLEELAAAEHRSSARVAAVQARLDQARDRIPRLRAQLERSREQAEQLRMQRDRARERTAGPDAAAAGRKPASTHEPEAP